MKRKRGLMALLATMVMLVGAAPAFAGGEPAPDPGKCNSGRGNSSETNTALLVDPHAGETGPGVVGTVDCDPGNSGSHNSGGD